MKFLLVTLFILTFNSTIFAADCSLVSATPTTLTFDEATSGTATTRTETTTFVVHTTGGSGATITPSILTDQGTINMGEASLSTAASPASNFTPNVPITADSSSGNITVDVNTTVTVIQNSTPGTYTGTALATVKFKCN